jgi:phosphate transport system substrate-binding protein
LVDLYPPIAVDNKDYYPTIAFQRVDIAPSPPPLSWSPELGVAAGVEKTLGTWNATKAQRLLHQQVSGKQVGKEYSNEAEGNRLPWEDSLRQALSKHRPKGIFALQPSADIAANPIMNLADQTIRVLPSPSTIRDAIKPTLPQTPAGKALEFVIIYAGINFATASATPSPADGGMHKNPAAAATIRIHGSNTIGVELAPALVEEFLKRENATNITRLPTDDPQQIVIQGTLPGQPQPEIIEILAHGSATAFADLPAERCDIGMSSRQIKADEAQACATAGLGNMFLPKCEHILGVDGITIIVNRANMIETLSKDQLAGIFSGRIRDWRDVGGSPGFIMLYGRDAKSGTFDTFKALVLGGANLPTSAHLIEDSRELSKKVAGDPLSIGFVGHPFIGENRALAISDRGTMPFTPNRFTIATEDYPLSRRLYFYTPATPPNPLVRKFLEFALADNEGQQVVTKHRFFGQRPTVVQPPTRKDTLPPVYANEIRDAARVDLNFRFRTGSSDLDSKAVADLDRLKTLLAKPEYAGKYLLLIGFADSTGSAIQNLALSKDRARAVALQLQSRGLTAALVTGFGQELAVAANDTPEGREKNRRVEVWLRDH